MKLKIRIITLFCWYLLRYRSTDKAKAALINWLTKQRERLHQEIDYLEKKRAVCAAEIILEKECESENPISKFVGTEVTPEEVAQIWEETDPAARDNIALFVYAWFITMKAETNQEKLVCAIQIAYVIGYLRGKYEMDREYLNK